jgi:hypothetical protein
VTRALAVLIGIRSTCRKILLAESVKATVTFIGLLVAIVGLILAYAVVPVKISGDRADDFFHLYFSKVARTGHRAEVYKEFFTASYHNSESLSNYKAFWKLAHRATALQSTPMGGPLEFEVTVTLHPAGSIPQTETIDYYLECTGILGAMYARFLECPIGDIKIDRLKLVG